MGARNEDGGLPVRRVSAAYLQRSRERSAGRAGLWSGSGNSYFDHTRTMRTLDPSALELELGMSGRDATAWCTPLREKNKGRVVV